MISCVHNRSTLPSQGFHGAPVQVLEALEAGAKAILLIVRALNDDELKILRNAADNAGLTCLYEIHEEAELEKVLPHN